MIPAVDPNYAAAHRAHVRSEAAQLEEYRAAMAHPDPEWAACYEEVYTATAERCSLTAPALDHVAAVGLGATLKHPSRDQWVTFFPDASHPGQYRWQQYGLDGFISHGTHSTLFQAALEAAQMGFTAQDDGAPDRLFGSARFECGNRITDVIRAVNAGQVSWNDAHRRVATIKAEYGADTPEESMQGPS